MRRSAKPYALQDPFRGYGCEIKLEGTMEEVIAALQEEEICVQVNP